MRRFWAMISALFVAVSAASAAGVPKRTVSIPAWVEEKDCAADPQFEATLNGKSAPVLTEIGPGSDQVILVVLDLTGDLSLIAAAKQALTEEINKLPPNSWVGLLRAQDGLQVLADPSPDRGPAFQALQALSNSGQPGLLETVDSALSLADALLRKSPVRVAVLYVTDGNIYSYREDYTNPVINASDPHDLSRRIPGALIEEKVSDLVNSFGSLEAPLFVVHLNYRGDRMNEVYQNGLETLAQATGGKATVCRSVGEIPEAIAEMFERISSAWRVTLAVPPKAHRDLQIRLSAPCHGENLRLSWRTHLYPKEG